MRRILLAILATAVVGGIGLSTVASAHGDGDHLHFVAKATSVEKADLADGGKQIIVAFDVFEHDHDDAAQYSAQDHTDEARAGHGSATCVSADREAGGFCSAALELDEGQLAVQGVVHHHSHGASSHDGGHQALMLPVTGGSGKYFGTSGEVEVTHADGHGNGHSAMAFEASPDDQNGKDGHGHALHLAFHLE